MIVTDIPDAEYHADRETISVSGAKLILDCPARFRHVMDNPVHRDAFDFGHVAHLLILGKGADFQAVDHDSWRTKAAREDRDEIRAKGLTPILAADLDTATRLAEAVKTHPIAGAMLATGTAEASMYGTHDETGVKLRGRADWITHKSDGTPVVLDIKTCASAAPDAIDKAMSSFGYAQQAAWYIDLMAQNGHPGTEFWFCFVEKTAPHLVTLARPSEDALAWGAAKNEKAIRLYHECTRTGNWPAYPTHEANVPAWAWKEVEDQ